MKGMMFQLLRAALLVLGFNAVNGAPFDGVCSADVAKNRFSIAPEVTFPAPYTYCFKLQANNCTSSGSSCCKNTTAVTTFLLDISEDCSYEQELFSVTFNGKPVSTFSAAAATAQFGTQAVLSVPGLRLDAKAMAAKGAQLCINLKRTSYCGSIDRLAPVDLTKAGQRWTSALALSSAASSNGFQCCPVTALVAPPPAKCQTCWVWDVLGPKGTAASAKYDFLSRNSCPLALMDPQDNQGWKNCCEYAAYGGGIVNAFEEARAAGMLTGFDKPICNRTSLMLCGTFNSMSYGQEMALAYSDAEGLRQDFDISDDTCPMSLIDSDVRLRSVLRNGTLDTRCTPLSVAVEDICWEPQIDMEPEYGQDSLTPFPNSTCNATRGITLFTIDNYYDVSYLSHTNVYCVTLGTATPKPAKSACSNATVLDKVSMWIRDGEFSHDFYLGAYLLTKEGGSTTYNKRTNLTASWGRVNENVYDVRSLGLDVATVRTKQPKVCIERDNEGQLWYDTMDPLGYLWVALYDTSGKCCPVYYSNRF